MGSATGSLTYEAGFFSCGVNRARVASMAERYRCAVCEMEESRCECDKYCCLCQGQDNVRLCADGQYYCAACREACDMEAQS